MDRWSVPTPSSLPRCDQFLQNVGCRTGRASAGFSSNAQPFACRRAESSITRAAAPSFSIEVVQINKAVEVVSELWEKPSSNRFHISGAPSQSSSIFKSGRLLRSVAASATSGRVSR